MDITEEEYAKLKHIEQCARFYMELPTDCWTGYYVRAVRLLNNALSNTENLKTMKHEDISKKSDYLQNCAKKFIGD